MFPMHTTRDGETIPISTMTNSHLVSTINVIAQSMAEKLSLLEGSVTHDDDVMGLFAEATTDKTRVRSEYLVLLNKLGAYCVEASLRDLCVQEELFPVFRRKKGVYAKRKSTRFLDGSSDYQIKER